MYKIETESTIEKDIGKIYVYQKKKNSDRKYMYVTVFEYIR